MIPNETIISVLNRFDGYTGYTLPDSGIQRLFNPGEKKNLKMDELRQLSYQEGGIEIIKNYLLIDNQEAIDELIGGVEPEYFYTTEDVKRLMLEGTLPEFLDMLDFAPAAVLEIIKTLAVKLELNDVKKRKAIFEKTGFDVSKAIEHIDEEKAAEAAEGKEEVVQTSTRRVQVPTKEAKNENLGGRRTSAPSSKYNVISKG